MLLISWDRMAKRNTVSIDDVLTAVETARDKVMADEVKQLIKLGLPKNVALKMVAERYRQRGEGEEGGEGEGQSPWPDMG
jgi:hypothetical protein